MSNGLAMKKSWKNSTAEQIWNIPDLCPSKKEQQ